MWSFWIASIAVIMSRSSLHIATAPGSASVENVHRCDTLLSLRGLYTSLLLCSCTTAGRSVAANTYGQPLMRKADSEIGFRPRVTDFFVVRVCSSVTCTASGNCGRELCVGVEACYRAVSILRRGPAMPTPCT